MAQQKHPGLERRLGRSVIGFGARECNGLRIWGAAVRAELDFTARTGGGWSMSFELSRALSAFDPTNNVNFFHLERFFVAVVHANHEPQLFFAFER